MTSTEKPVQLHIMHSWGGGVERWVQDYTRADAVCNNMVLKSSGVPGLNHQRLALYSDINSDEPMHTWELIPSIHAISITHAGYRSALDEIIRNYKVSSILISSFIGHSLDILNTGISTAIICHDYYPFCPAVNIYFDGVCSKCEINDLERCFNENRNNWVSLLASAPAWVEVRRIFLELIRRYHITLVAPSDSVRRNLIGLEHAFKDVNFRIIPHGAELPELPEAHAELAHGSREFVKLKLLILGRLAFHKGMEVLREIYSQILQVADIYLLGCGAAGRVFDGIEGIHIVAEDYLISDLSGIIRQISPDMGLLLSIWPETFSYTLSELMLLNIPALTTKLGSFEDRIVDGVNGFLVEPQKNAILSRIKDISKEKQLLLNVADQLKNIKHRSLEEMVCDYHNILAPDDKREDFKALRYSNYPEMCQAESARAGFHIDKTYVRLNQTQAELNQSRAELDQSRVKRAELEITITSKDAVIRARESELVHIYDSNGWKLLLKYYKLRDVLLPFDSKRRGVLKLIFNSPRLLKKSNMRKFFFYMGELGVKSALVRTKQKVVQNFFSPAKNLTPVVDYDLWIRRNEPGAAELERQRGIRFQFGPKISIVVPTFNTPQRYLKEMIESVLGQTYTNWEMCIADGGSQGPQRDIINEYAKADDRIKVSFQDMNKGIAGNSNEALSLASGDFIALLDHDDTLSPCALFEVVNKLNENPDAGFIYSDFAVSDKDGNILNLMFCPDFCRYYFLSHPYIVHLVVIKKSILDKVGAFDVANFNDGVSQDVDLFLRIFAEMSDRDIEHIPKVLYYWKHFEKSSGHILKDKVHHYTKKAIQRYMERTHFTGRVEDGEVFNSFRIRPAIEDRRLISIIIPTKNKWQLLDRCLRSIEEKAGYDNYEVLIVKNNTDDEDALRYLDSLPSKYKVIEYALPFNFSAINNFAANISRGDALLFLNDDVEFKSDGVLIAVLELLQLKEIGIVGAKLLYPDERIQHSGVIIGLHGIAEHWHKFVNAYASGNIPDYGYIASLVSIREYAAVTGAFLLTKKEVFEKVGGFSEELAVGLNDIDYCLKVLSNGYKILVSPYAVAYHYENASRKEYKDKDPDLFSHPKDSMRFLEKWAAFIEKGDPYYNPNLDKKSFVPIPRL